jgi:hypothetical protein
MANKQSIIESAFARCGIIPEEQGLSSAELVRMNVELNELVDIFYDDGIVIPFLISDNLSDDSNCSLAQEGALSNSLAINVMAIYANHRPVSQALANRAKQSKRALRNRSFSTAQKSLPSTLSRGSGNYTYGSNGRSSGSRFYNNRSQNRVILSNKEPIMDNNGSPLYFDPITWRT